MEKPSKKTRKLTPEEESLLQEGWEEIGKSIAIAVVHGGKSRLWAWQTIKPIGLYEHWMLIAWIERCKKEIPKADLLDPKKNGRPRVVTREKRKSVFRTAEELKEALRLIHHGANPDDIIEMYSNRSK